MSSKTQTNTRTVAHIGIIKYRQANLLINVFLQCRLKVCDREMTQTGLDVIQLFKCVYYSLVLQLRGGSDTKPPRFCACAPSPESRTARDFLLFVKTRTFYGHHGGSTVTIPVSWVYVNVLGFDVPVAFICSHMMLGGWAKLNCPLVWNSVNDALPHEQYS